MPSSPPNRAASPRRSGGRRFIYRPTGLEAWNPKPGQPRAGTVVRVSEASIAGPASTPYAYIEDAETGEFHGMVPRAHLIPHESAEFVPGEDISNEIYEGPQRRRNKRDTNA